MELPTFHRAENSKKSELRQNVETVQNPIISAVLPEITFSPVFMAHLLTGFVQFVPEQNPVYGPHYLTYQR